MATDVTGTGLPWVEAIAASFDHHDFEQFNRSTLPAASARHGHLVVDDLRNAPPLAFRCGASTFTWTPADSGVVVRDGSDGASTIVEMSADTFSEWVDELITTSGSLRTGRANLVQGDSSEWARWEPAFRSLMTGRPMYSTAVWETLVDRDGTPLELDRRFEPDDDPDEMRHFLRTAGYLHVRGGIDAETTALLGEEVARAAASTEIGDPFSWWSVNASGEEVVTRINYVGRHSEIVQRFCFDPRLSHYAGLATDEPLRVCDDRLDGPMVFIKNSNVVKGSGDLVWHVDDGIGGHPVMCPLLQVGVQLDHANPENGQLLVLAGSHRYSKHWIAWGEENDLPAVAFVTEPGDVTVHFGDTMHTTPAPTGPNAGRRVLYYKFATAKTFDWVPAGCHYNDALFSVQDGKVSHRAAYE